MLRSMPVLQVRDVNASVAFYCGKLGFESTGTWPDENDVPSFAIVRNGDVTLAFDRSRDEKTIPLNQYWAAYIYVEDADALHETAKAAGVEITIEPGDRFYGLRDFSARDIDGHILAFGHDLDPSN